jgi:hypothetical protein
VTYVTPLTEAACKACGQREGPFPGIREALRVLGACGWIRVPPPEAWRGGSWAGGYPNSWYCAHCAVTWHRERRERQRACRAADELTAMTEELGLYDAGPDCG